MKKLQKRICYLICVYNDQQGLETTLTSIFQDDPLADLLIIDDGSVSPVVLPSIPDKFDLTLERIEPNGGLIAALNRGLTYILEHDYEFIARLDAGDTVNQGRLNAQLTYMDANPSVGLLGTQLRAFDQNSGETLFHFNNPTEPSKVSNILKQRNCIAHPSVMMRCEVIRQTGFYGDEYKYAEDYEMWRRIENFCDVANLSKIYVNKEISPNQITAMNRRGSSLSKLKAQIKFFEIFNMHCWLGVGRTILSLLIPRVLLNHTKKKLNKS